MCAHRIDSARLQPHIKHGFEAAAQDGRMREDSNRAAASGLQLLLEPGHLLFIYVHLVCAAAPHGLMLLAPYYSVSFAHEGT